MSKSRDAVEDIRTIDTVTATANAALPKAGGALTGTVTNFTSTGIDDNATSTAVTIDASENVGIGSTPATDWHTNYSVLQVGGQADIWTHKAVGAGKALHISHNAEYDTGFKYIANDEATLYVQGDGAHRFSHGAYGTAGSAISFVERLKIDADGLTFKGNTGGAATALDDYEEGTFNATVTTGTATYLHGRYVKVGSVVTATCLIYGFSNRTSTGDAISFQLPFSTPSGEAYGGGGNAMFRYISSVNDATIAPYISGSLLELFQCNQGNYTQIKHSQLANTSARIYFTVTYRTA